MKKTMWTTLVGGAALAAAFAAPAAHARTDVHVQIGTPYYPVYTQPGYVVTGPQYHHAPRHYAPRHNHGSYHRHHHRRDRDGDGVPNRWDRDRDGDGVSNRWDRRPNNPYRY